MCRFAIHVIFGPGPNIISYLPKRRTPTITTSMPLKQQQQQQHRFLKLRLIQKTITHMFTRWTIRTIRTTTTTVLQTKMFSMFILVGLCLRGWIVSLSLMLGQIKFGKSLCLNRSSASTAIFIACTQFGRWNRFHFLSVL